MAFSPETYAMLKGQSGGGGSGLPSVTEADNGKVLSVVNGAWAADARGKVVMDEDYVLDKSFNDLLAMFNQGIVPWLIEEFEDDGLIIYRFLTCSFVFTNEGDYCAEFSCIDRGNQIYDIGFINSDPTAPMYFD